MLITYGQRELWELFYKYVKNSMDNGHELRYFDLVVDIVKEKHENKYIIVNSLHELLLELDTEEYTRVVQNSEGLDVNRYIHVYNTSTKTINSFYKITDWSKCPKAEHVTEFMIRTGRYTLEYEDDEDFKMEAY